MAIKKGDKIKVDYEGRFEDGTIFDSSSHGDHSHALEFTVGAGQVILGFDESVIGMKKNEEKEFKLKPEEGYGERREELKQMIPRNVLPKNQEPKKGMGLIMNTPEGHQLPVKILDVDEKFITVDLNHPLAGKTLIFKIKIVSIESNNGKGGQNGKKI